MPRKDDIRMSQDEIRSYLREGHTMVLTTNGPRGYPHALAMFYSLDDDLTVRIATYERSQKVRNIERDPRVTLLVESGEAYEELKGVVLYGHAELIRDPERVIDTLIEANKLGDRADPKVRDMMRSNAAKRVLIEIKPEKVVSWDHSKLGGVY